MKHLLLLLSIALVFNACKENNATSQEPIQTVKTTKEYPENISKVFEAHGGLDKWKEMETLVFTMNAEGDNTTITTDLQNRMALLETENFKIGFDGKEAWVEQDSTYFENDPNFYYDLMFYFYAMPFILADDGINYSDAAALTFRGTDYPGIKISYNSGVGASPEDEYILYFNPETHKMEWLGYTVTYFSKEKSSEFKYIKYNDWQNVEGLSLPKSLQWYGFENDSISSMKNERIFSNVKLMREKMPESMFSPSKELH